MIRTGDILHNPVTGETLHFIETAADTERRVRASIDGSSEPDGFVAARPPAPVPDRGVRGPRGRDRVQGRRQGRSWPARGTS